jgi:hypothetical protein
MRTINYDDLLATAKKYATPREFDAPFLGRGMCAEDSRIHV